jgi:hypothetical protein
VNHCGTNLGWHRLTLDSDTLRKPAKKSSAATLTPTPPPDTLNPSTGALSATIGNDPLQSSESACEAHMVLQTMIRPDKLCVGASRERERGVFAFLQIEKHEIIECAHVIAIPETQRPFFRNTVLRHYYFNWGVDYKDAAIALGYGSLYNHSVHPNAGFAMQLAEKVIHFYALATIRVGEEITINYNSSPGETYPVPFTMEI